MYASTFYQENKGTEIARLFNACPSVASEFLSFSRLLLRLPLELRNMIYANLYTDSTPGYRIHTENYPDWDDPRYRTLPPDPFCYMSASLVNYQVAAEAAAIFYSTNYFEFPIAAHARLEGFLGTDHYGSGVAAREVLTKLCISRPLENLVDLVMAPSYAVDLRDFAHSRSARLAFPKDAVWTPLLNAPHLRSVDFRVYSDWPQSVGTPEMLMLKMLEMRGVATNMALECVPKRGFGDYRDYSRTFNEPTKDEVESVGEEKPVDVLDWETENRLGVAVDGNSEDIAEDEDAQREDAVEDNTDDDSDDSDSDDGNGDDAYCHHSFAPDSDWEAKWRVYLQRMYDGLWLEEQGPTSRPTSRA